MSLTLGQSRVPRHRRQRAAAAEFGPCYAPCVARLRASRTGTSGAATASGSPAALGDLRWRRGALALLVGTLGLLAAPRVANAGPPDEWSLEHDERDLVLVGQRLNKLHAAPFDTKQWRALEKALGAKGLRQRIEARAKANPKDVAWSILAARAAMAAGQPAAAVERLAEVSASLGKQGGSFAERVFALRIDAMTQAGESTEAIQLLLDREARLRGGNTKAAIQAADQAHRLAVRHGHSGLELSAAERLATLDPSSSSRQRDYANAALRSGDATKALAILERAEQSVPAKQRDSWTAARADVASRNGQSELAAKLWWELLRNPNRGASDDRAQRWQALEMSERAAGRAAQFIEDTERWLAEHPTTKEAAVYRALAQAQSASGLDARASWRRAAELAPRDDELRWGVISSLEASGDIDAAIEHWESIDAQGRADLGPALELAERLRANGDNTRAWRIFTGASQRTKKDANRLLALLDWVNEAGDLDAGLEIAKRLVAASPRDPDARVALGEQYFQMNRLEEAVEEWSKLPQISSPAHAGWARLAEILSEHQGQVRRREMTARAQQALNNALSAAPDRVAYLRQRAILEQDTGARDRALETWLKVRELARGRDQELLRTEARTRIVDLLVSSAFRGQGSRRTEIEKQARASLDGDDLQAALEDGALLAELYLRDEKTYDDAILVLQRLVDLEPKSADALIELATALRRANRNDESAEALRKAAEVDPSRSADALAMLSELAHERGEQDSALGAAKRAATIGNDRGHALLHLAQLRIRNGDLRGAELALDALEAMSPDADNQEARFLRAELSLTRGQHVLAREAYVALVGQGGNTQGGNDELARRAFSRALDLSQTKQSGASLTEAVLKRIQRTPQSEEPRELLLLLLEGQPESYTRAWIEGNGDPSGIEARQAQLRTPLVALLGRASATMRARAAQQIGRFRLPETSLVLLQIGSQLSAPPDAPTPVRLAIEQARVESVLAVAALGDTSTVPQLQQLAARAGAEDSSASTAAIWTLGQLGTAEARAALRTLMQQSSSRAQAQAAALMCLGLIPAAGQEDRRSSLSAVRSAAGRATDRSTIDACRYAELRLTTDQSAVTELRDALASVEQAQRSSLDWTMLAYRVAPLAARGPAESPERAAMWRLWAASRGRPVQIAEHALLSAAPAYRDAVARALHVTATASQTPASPAAVPGTRNDEIRTSGRALPWAVAAAWSPALDRWLHREVAAQVPALSPDERESAWQFVAQREAAQIRAAFRTALDGTRAEQVSALRRVATSSITDACDPSLWRDGAGASEADATEGKAGRRRSPARRKAKNRDDARRPSSDAIDLAATPRMDPATLRAALDHGEPLRVCVDATHGISVTIAAPRED